MEISRDLLPDSFNRLIPVWQLELDPYNVREEQPTDDLVESVRKTGFRDAAIVRPIGDGKYLVTDGWQRVQAGVRAGWTEIPCNVYPTALEALKEASRASIKREWTGYQRIKHYRNYYNACIEAGMEHWEAIQTTVRDNPANEQTVLKYLRITRLPAAVLALLKNPENRTTQEWNELEKIYLAIRQKRKTLRVNVADAIAVLLRNFPPRKKVEAAIGVLGLKVMDAVDMIRAVSKYPEASPLEVILELKMGYGPEEILDIGVFIVDPKLKRTLREYCSTRRITLKDFVRKLLTEWCSTEGGVSLEFLEPAPSGKAGMKEVSFQVGKRRVSISKHHEYTTILVDDSAPIFFTQRDIEEKAWNINARLPDRLKKFLNSLKIET